MMNYLLPVRRNRRRGFDQHQQLRLRSIKPDETNRGVSYGSARGAIDFAYFIPLRFRLPLFDRRALEIQNETANCVYGLDCRFDCDPSR
jgi:hypothetical protein